MSMKFARFAAVLVTQSALLCAGAAGVLPLSAQAQAGASPATPAVTPLPAPITGKDAAPVVPTDKDKAPPEKDKPAADKPPEKTPHIALLLPSGSKVFGKVADAVKLGFIAGAEADGKNAPAYRIYAADDDGDALAATYRKAAKDGAIALIGGITRDGAAAMAKESSYLPTLALNAPPDGDTPDRFFYISLSLDWEARMVARAAFEEGIRRIVSITAATPLAKRIQESFEKEWLRLGGEITLRIPYAGDSGEADRIRTAVDKFFDKESEKYKFDAVFIAADTRTARYARPYLPTGIPVFATSHTLDPRAGAVENLDLDSVRFLEMPWFVEKDHPAVMVYPRPADDMPIDYERLYALGIDAWRLAQVIVKYDKTRDIPTIDGVTGRLTLDGGHQFIRRLTAVEMRDGQPQPYRPSE
jgi:hypothetical protein